MLSQQQIDFFHAQGYLMVEQAIPAALLAELRAEMAGWVEESRHHQGPYGRTLDGRPRFDVEPGHRFDRPALRRVASPTEISATCHQTMAASAVPGLVAQLIGPNLKFHHAKINSKQPGTATAVKWHQDFPFTPHSNDDLVTALLFLDDVTDENGPLEVVPGSHRGPIYDLWHGGRFTGAVDETVAADCARRAVRCAGPAGSLCLMHTRLLHGSAVNHGHDPRTLFIAVYSAEDAVPLAANPLPSKDEGLVVRGHATGLVRGTGFSLRLPEKPQGASFFTQQAGAF